MRIPVKMALGLLALTVALPATYAQTPGPVTPPPQRSAQVTGEAGPWQGPQREVRYRVRVSRRGMRGPGRRMRRGWDRGGPATMLLRLVNNPTMRQRVGITTEQAEKIRQQTSNFLKEQIRSRANIKIARIDLRNLMAAENPNRASINTALDHIGALRLAQTKAAVDFRLTMRNALTPEQRQKLMQMHREFMRHGRGGRMGPGRMMMRHSRPSPPQKPPQN